MFHEMPLKLYFMKCSERKISQYILPLRNSDKSLLSPEQNKLKKSETRFCRRKTAEENNAKINVSPNIPSTFFLFKTSTFLQIFFPRNLIFRQVLKTSVFLSSKCLTFLYLFISLLKNTIRIIK